MPDSPTPTPAMSQPAMHYDSAETLRASYQLFKDQQPGIRARNAAQELGVSEGELLAAHVGNNATRLPDAGIDWAGLRAAWEGLLFGKRKPGIPELPAWRAIVDSIPPLTTDHVS